LGEVMKEGVQVEVLSWQMDLEQPDAASIISQALNAPQQMGMRTTELTAMSELKGEIIVQMGPNLSQDVAFKTVLARVRSQLHTAADDPDLPELFDFLVSNGVGINGYVEGLIDWTTAYVDSKKRQLRFQAFAPINKMDARAPRSKVAVVKRAYRKAPVNGFCPSPENAWKDFSWAHLEKMEELLRFFHNSCKAIIDKTPPASRVLFLGNIDVAVAEAFWHTKPATKDGLVKLEENLFAGISKHLVHVGLDNPSDAVTQLPHVAEWIKKQLLLVKPGLKEVEASTDAAPKIIHFNEESGEKLCTQHEFDVLRNETKEKVMLPWREWHSGSVPAELDAGAERATAVAVLNNLHHRYDVTKVPIDVWLHCNGRICVTAKKR
jgi:hypothetical protein